MKNVTIMLQSDDPAHQLSATAYDPPSPAFLAWMRLFGAETAEEMDAAGAADPNVAQAVERIKEFCADPANREEIERIQHSEAERQADEDETIVLRIRITPR
ncbi:MAG: hypothetical protein FWH11_06415 [Micrococcales bacterium]|nr:hypothetical protein [Micrococcales bacterium]